MADTAAQLATYEDLLAVPEHLIAEIIHGQLHTSPRPAPKHARAASSLGGELFNPFDRGHNGPGGWIILDEPELHLGSHVLVPDLAGWKRNRMPELPDTAWFELTPDWICEVLSPATVVTDRTRKMPIYAEFQVSYLWLIDPDVKILEAYELQNGQWVLLKTLADDDIVGVAPFDATEFSLASLWS